MRRVRVSELHLVLLACGAILLLSACPVAADTTLFDETKATTVFAFDDASIPFTQNLKLQMRSPQKHPQNPVVRRGSDGAVDSWAVQFYGSVIRDPQSGKFRMWYVAVSKAERLAEKMRPSVPWRVAYAESSDGIHWIKPSLGLVEASGSADNNLVKLEPHLGVLNLKVLDEPDDPNPKHRYKMGAHVWYPKNDRRNGTFAPFVSADGLSWRLLTDANPVNAEMPASALLIPTAHFEPVGGLYKWDGLYYLSGQNAIVASRPYHGRVSRTFASADFKNWMPASAIQFVRSPQHHLLGPGKSRMGEQTHEGISVWNRGNVLVGISGMWHGTADWKDLTIDLGLVVSNDGVHFREPMHEHIFLKRSDDGAWDAGGLLQAQGFENIGDKTLIYYGAWDPRGWEQSPPRGGVGIATLPRDRFADLVVDKTTEGSGDYQMRTTASRFLTTALPIKAGTRRFYVNADGLSEDARLRIELLDNELSALPALSGASAAIVSQSGFQTPIVWNGKHEIEGLPDRVRLQVTFEGISNTHIHFNAIYVQ
ncbi:MAG TPA: hypothetical protein P5307_01010 [Pirellulaceae bacterium]|nr:hypothetical protein [Pirellulaceae bacterium]